MRQDGGMGWEVEKELGLHLMPALVQGCWCSCKGLVADVGTLTSPTKAHACQQCLLKWTKRGRQQPAGQQQGRKRDIHGWMG